MLAEETGSFSLVLERLFSPFPIHELHRSSDLDLLFNRGRVPVATSNKAVFAPNLQISSKGGRNSGFVIFSSKFLTSQGLKFLNDQNGHVHAKLQRDILASPISQLVCIFSEKEPGDGEWAHGSFPLEVKHSFAPKASFTITTLLECVTARLQSRYVGSCIQTDAELILMRDGESFDMKKKLPFSVGLSLHLLKKNHRVFVTCTTGFDRSATCVIAYLHWMTDTPLHAAHNFVTGLHPCQLDRAAIAWATWDLIAMVEGGRHDGPATRAVIFVSSGHNEDVNVIKVIERPLTENEQIMLATAARCMAFSVCPIRLVLK